MATIERWAIALLLICALCGASFVGGCEHGKVQYDLLKASLDSQEKQAAAAAESAKTRLDAAMVSLNLTEKRVQDVLRKKTVGRTCLDPDAVRVLNDMRTGRIISEPDSGTGSGPRAVATDTAVAGILSSDNSQYETCRARLQAVRRAAGSKE